MTLQCRLVGLNKHLVLIFWLSEGSCHVSAPACRRWVLPWLQAVRWIYPVQQRPPVLAACRCLEIQVSKELMALRWKSWLENSGINVPVRVPRKGLVCVNRDENMVGVFLCFHQLAVLGQHVSTFMYLCLQSTYFTEVWSMRKKVFMEEVVAGRRAVTSLFICAALHRGKNDGKKFIGIWISGSAILQLSWTLSEVSLKNTVRQ